MKPWKFENNWEMKINKSRHTSNVLLSLWWRNSPSIHHKDSRNLMYAWICLSSFLSCFQTFMASFCLCDYWIIHLRDVNYMVVPWILCCFNEWCFDFFCRFPICKFDNYWWSNNEICWNIPWNILSKFKKSAYLIVTPLILISEVVWTTKN